MDGRDTKWVVHYQLGVLLQNRDSADLTYPRRHPVRPGIAPQFLNQGII